MFNNKYLVGFTLVELLVVISIIGLLSTILFASFDESRAQARDKARLVALKEMQLAIEQYRSQTGEYPQANCGSATDDYSSNFAGPAPAIYAGVPDFLECVSNAYRAFYIKGLVPDYIARLPFDSKFELENDRGFYYRSDKYSYKLMAYDVVEALTVDSFTHEFARCPSAIGACAGGVPTTTYAVYSPGAEDW